MIPDDKKTYRIVLDESMLESEMAVSSDENRFDNIYFDFNSSKLRKEALPILDGMAEALKRDKTRKMVIHAHTDALGSIESNIEIAEKRGLVVKQYLVKKGVNSSRIEIDPVGAAQPIASNDKDLGRQLNRRVEFEILY